MSATTLPEITDEIVEQLREVRETGLANMLARHDVQYVANDLELHALVVFCYEVGELAITQRGKVWVAALERMNWSRA